MAIENTPVGGDNAEVAPPREMSAEVGIQVDKSRGGEREQEERRGSGVTSGLGGRGDLRSSSLGSCPLGTSAVTDPKQTNTSRTG